MKSSIAAMALAGSLAALGALTARAQGPSSGTATPRVANASGPLGRLARSQPSAPSDLEVNQASVALPEPTLPDQIRPPTIALPNDAIEPYLLTKDAGPFMVMAKSFRGPEAERFALALALELRREYGLPAYILRSKDFPRNSNIRNVPPTAPAGVDRARLGDPERVRTFDEAVVLVGNEPTLKGSDELLHKVKKINPKCLNGMPALFHWRQGLKLAFRTTNPYIPSQNLFPGKQDRLIIQMNDGPRSIFHCPGRFALQIAEFSGRSTFNVMGANVMGDSSLKRSPLYTAADDAQKLADALARTPEIRQTGQQVYVYHDRTASRVLIGSFQSPNDPEALKLRDYLLRNAVTLMDTQKQKRGVDKMIVPATYLTDLEPIKPR